MSETGVERPETGGVREVKSAARTVELLELLAARGDRPARLQELADELGVPRHEFMLAANDEYRKRGGTDSGHIGAIAIAILALLDQTRS